MLTLIALSALVLQEPASAPTPPPAGEPHRAFVFTTGAHDDAAGLDADSDGQVTRAEFGRPMDDAFARLDADSDGRLSGDELPESLTQRGDVVLHRDAHGPGERRVELRRAGPAEEREIHFERGGGRTVMILDRDGEVAESRFTVRTDGDHHASAPGAAFAGGRIEVFRVDAGGPDRRLDADGDGKVSEAEFLSPLREAFARADADRSGFIEAGERGEGDVQVFTHRIERSPRGD
jgi:EF hand/EF-hand domain pair